MTAELRCNEGKDRRSTAVTLLLQVYFKDKNSLAALRYFAFAVRIGSNVQQLKLNYLRLNFVRVEILILLLTPQHDGSSV